jgi:hypothetical protein
MPKSTTAQLWLIHTLETLFFGAVVAGGIATYTAFSTGHYTITALLSIFLSALVAVVSKGSSAVINNANALQAAQDTITQGETLLAAVTQGHQSASNKLNLLLVQPPLVQIIPAPVQAAPPIVAPQPAPVAQPQPVQQKSFDIPQRPTMPMASMPIVNPQALPVVV